MYPIAHASGSVLISNRFFDKLPQDLQKILLDVSKEKFPRLISLTRKANGDSIKAMEKAGIALVDKPEDKDLKPFLKAGETVRNNLVGKLYSKELLEKINSSLHSFRAKQAEIGE
jgi:TRAP-type C4-dicarboxylate transport system substrate-binding protein